MQIDDSESINGNAFNESIYNHQENLLKITLSVKLLH